MAIHSEREKEIAMGTVEVVENSTAVKVAGRGGWVPCPIWQVYVLGTLCETYSRREDAERYADFARVGLALCSKEVR
jgi:hypothetical protein